MEFFKQALSRRRFLQATGVAGAAGAVGVSRNGLTTLSEAQAQTAAPAGGEYTITKSICHQCPARCGSARQAQPRGAPSRQCGGYVRS